MRPPLLLASLLALTACKPDTSDVVAPSLEPAVQDGLPGATTPSPDGKRLARVAPGGELTVTDDAGNERMLATSGALHVVGFSPDGRHLAWGQLVDGPETDLFTLDLTSPDDTAPTVLTDWPGAEDRPVWSPDGERVAFVSGRTGIASVWVIGRDGSDATQLTNVGLEDAPRVPGQPPEGFVPPPQSGFRWLESGELHWQADGTSWSVEAP